MRISFIFFYSLRKCALRLGHVFQSPERLKFDMYGRSFAFYSYRHSYFVSPQFFYTYFHICENVQAASRFQSSAVPNNQISLVLFVQYVRLHP